ncbi:hypothetical protein INR49_023312, partial [Caranx melampygus]
MIYFFLPAFPNKTRVAILAELEKERRRLIQNSSMNTPGARYRQYTHITVQPSLKEFRDNAEQQHIAAQQKAALQHAHAHSSGFFITQDSSFGNLILPVLPRLEPDGEHNVPTSPPSHPTVPTRETPRGGQAQLSYGRRTRDRVAVHPDPVEGHLHGDAAPELLEGSHVACYHAHHVFHWRGEIKGPVVLQRVKLHF